MLRVWGSGFKVSWGVEDLGFRAFHAQAVHAAHRLWMSGR